MIEGRDVDLSPWNNYSIGVGIGGKLGLIADRCVGFVSRDVGAGSVIVWPPGTEFSGEGESLRIHSEGKTVRLGDDIEGGNEFGHDFSGIRQKLPLECRSADPVQVGLNS